jgi:hypothetical protein
MSMTIALQGNESVAALRDADPEQKLDLYRALGLQLTYQPDTRTVDAMIDLAVRLGRARAM